MVWQRRKIDADCHNPLEHEVTSKEYACKCTDKDYECDFCYERAPDGTCQLETTSTCELLKKVGSANWEGTGLSGPASYGSPGSGAYGSLLSGALERSNVDIAEELVGLITAQRNFQANAKAIDTATQISQTVINLRT